MGDAVTWIWQGSLVAVLLAAALRAAAALRVTAATRYALCWIGLGIVMTLPFVPALAGALAAGGHPAGEGREVLTLPGAPTVFVTGTVAAWALFAAGALARLALDLRRLRRLKVRARPMPDGVQRRLPLWQSARHGGRRAQLAVVEDRVAASVLGFRRPMIVVPRALLDALSDAELDQIVAHEHAHVERRDDWTNLLQRVIAVPFGLHPAVWLIGRWMHRERELAADERVALRTGAPREYARCLARVAEAMAGCAAPALASGALGCRGVVAQRVAHLVGLGRRRARRPSPWTIGAAGLVATAVALLVGGRAPEVELGVGRGAVPPVRLALPPAPTLSSAAPVAPPFVAGAARDGAVRPRVPGVGVPAPPVPELLAAGRTFDRRVPFGPLPGARPVPELLAAGRTFDRRAPFGLLPGARPGIVGRRPDSPDPLPARGLGLPAHQTLVAPAAGNVAGESRWAWGERTGTAIGSWFAEAGRTTGGAFRDFGASLTRTFTGRR
ncbi:MAG: M48 family metalloprotease [Acidobacteria bacterium]|nr:M48 family metalloprotease [Acidobacteriota bacterium]